MTRATIDFGVDLGTTNSSIAVFSGVGAEVIRNNEDSESTPSAVFIDRKGALFVGRIAKQRLESDPDEARSEFKLQMGKATTEEFLQSGRKFSPEQLSAEVLKSLKADVKQRKGEEVSAAVITVPAAFDLPQCAATRRAAELAGLTASPLLQEPVAAALAYGFQTVKDKVFWLIYDLGGGTFDAAVIQVRDGLIQVVNHEGDNHLGGKMIDWAIVEQILIPELRRRYRLERLERGNRKFRRLIAKLKAEAEEAKIRLSRNERIEIAFEFAGQDDSGQAIAFEHELARKDVELLAEPIVLRSINICKKLLREIQLGTDHIEKVVLVGGPTLMPFLRDRLTDREHGLGTALDFSVSPLTVVAQGAAIFAGTQRVDAPVTAHKPGEYPIRLEYKPVGAELEPLVGGRVAGRPGESLNGFTVEFMNIESLPPWRSGRLGLAADGTFVTTLLAERGRLNTFFIELRNAAGDKREVVPNRLMYTIGLAITDQPLTHSVSVAKANNQVQRCFQKGTPLPARKRVVLRQAFEVRRGQSGGMIRVPIVEGENSKADRNSRIGHLEISAATITRDVPAGSEVEITLSMDQSRTLKVAAFVPILDSEFECVINYSDYMREATDPDQLRAAVDREVSVMATLRRQAEEQKDRRSLATIKRLDEEGLVEEVETSLAASRVDPDAADKCQKRLLDLRLALDEMEASLEWPGLVREAEEQTRATKELLTQVGDQADRKLAESLEADVRKALDGGDPEHLRGKVEELRSLYFRLMQDQPAFWVDFLAYLEARHDTMDTASQRDQLFARAAKAVSENDLPVLQATVRQLYSLLPDDEQAEATRAFGSTVL